MPAKRQRPLWRAARGKSPAVARSDAFGREAFAAAGDVGEFDSIVAVDEIGQTRDPDGSLVALGRQALGEVGDDLTIMRDEGAFEPPEAGGPEKRNRGL